MARQHNTTQCSTGGPRFVAWPLELGSGTHNPRFVAWPLELGLGTHNPRFVAWPLELGSGTHNPCFVARPLKLGLGTHNPRFVAWPLELGLGTHPCILGDPQKKGGQNQKWVPHPCLLGSPKKGGNATSPLHSGGSLAKGTKSKVAELGARTKLWMCSPKEYHQRKLWQKWCVCVEKHP